MEENNMLVNSAVADAMNVLSDKQAQNTEQHIEQPKKSIVTGMIMDDATTNRVEVDEEKKQIQETAITGQQFEQLLRMRKQRPMMREHDKIGRNDPCPCGSGKKYKKCCLASGEYEHMKVVN